MSNNFLNNVMDRSGSHIHLSETHEPHSFVMQRLPGGQVANKKTVASAVVLQNSRDLLFSAQESTATLLSSGGSVTVRVNSGMGGICHGQTLQFTILNDGTSADLTAVPASLMINRIEIYFNGGSQLVQTIYGDQIFLDNNMLPQEKWAGVASVSNTGATFGIGSALADDASITYRVPFHSIMSQCELFLGGLADDVIYKVYFHGGATKILEDGATVPVLSDVNIILHTRDVPPATYAQMKRKYQEGFFDHPFLEVNRLEHSATYNNSTTYSQTLSAISGLVSHMWISLRAGPLDGDAMRTFQVLSSFNLYDAGGANITGLTSIPSDLNRHIQSMTHYPNTLQQNLAVYSWSHSASIMHAQETGANLGCYAYSGKERLDITTAGSGDHTNGTFVLNVWAYIYRNLRINKGLAEVSQS